MADFLGLPSLDFWIPGAPVPKGRPRLARNGRVYTPARTREYELLVAKHATIAMVDADWSMMDGIFSLEVIVQRSRCVGDLDNYLKAVSDGLNGVVWPDDSMVHRIIARFANGDRQNPGVWVRVFRSQPDPGDNIGRKNSRKAAADGVRARGKTE